RGARSGERREGTAAGRSIAVYCRPACPAAHADGLRRGHLLGLGIALVDTSLPESVLWAYDWRGRRPDWHDQRHRGGARHYSRSFNNPPAGTARSTLAVLDRNARYFIRNCGCVSGLPLPIAIRDESHAVGVRSHSLPQHRPHAGLEPESRATANAGLDVRDHAVRG